MFAEVPTVGFNMIAPAAYFHARIGFGVKEVELSEITSTRANQLSFASWLGCVSR